MKADILSLPHQEVQFIYPGLESGLWSTNKCQKWCFKSIFKRMAAPTSPLTSGLLEPQAPSKKSSKKTTWQTAKKAAHQEIWGTDICPLSGCSSQPLAIRAILVALKTPSRMFCLQHTSHGAGITPFCLSCQGPQNCVQNKMQFRSSMFSCR